MRRVMAFVLAAIATGCAFVPGTLGPASGSGRRKPITIGGGNVTGDLTDFPLWIDLTDPEVMAGAQPDARDLSFTDVDGTPIAFEIQDWDPDTGHLQAWVKIPQLTQGTDTVIYLRYGDPSIVEAPSSAAVFSNGFAAVWHLDDALTSPAVVDATGTRPGAAIVLGSANQVTAKLGGGIEFTGTTTERIRFNNPLSGNSNHTMSAWVSQRAPTSGRYDAIVVLGNGSSLQARWFYSHYQVGIAAGFYGGANDREIAVDVTSAAGDFTLLHWVFDAATKTTRFYRDGFQLDASTLPNSPITAGADGYIGYGPGSFGNVAMKGILDEVRISTDQRSAGWIATEFANQSAPSTFVSVGAEQAVTP